MNTVLIFDLDDTLYDESDYVQSGFRAVAEFLEEKYEIESLKSIETMNYLLKDEGRGKIFDHFLELNGFKTKALIKQCISVYRHHHPSISLYPEAKALLETLDNSLYLVTDGHKIVQQKKVEALHIYNRFKKVFITHRYGIIHAKPSIYCFNKIRILEKCSWSDMVYIGDNPMKDFINLKKIGVRTVRVLTGCHRSVIMDEAFDAEYVIPNLSYLLIRCPWLI